MDAALCPERLRCAGRLRALSGGRGPTGAKATGLSCYYSYNGDVDDLNGYIGVGESTAFKHLYAYELTGELAEDGEEYLSSLDIGELPERVTLPNMGWDGAPLDVDDDGIAFPDARAEGQ